MYKVTTNDKKKKIAITSAKNKEETFCNQTSLLFLVLYDFNTLWNAPNIREIALKWSAIGTSNSYFSQAQSCERVLHGIVYKKLTWYERAFHVV